MATTTGMTNLDSTYTSLINYQIQVESQPLTRLTEQKTLLETQRAAYNDLKTKLEQLRTATKALLSTDSFYSLKEGRQVSVVPGTTGSTVVSASVSSSAVAASYKIDVTTLAKNDRVRSNQLEYSDQALGKTGTFYIGGSAASSAVLVEGTQNTTVTGFSTGTIDSGQAELGTNNYSIETRKDSSDVWQFRLVDSEGNAVKIKNGTSFLTDWQTIPTDGQPYSTGRGLNINFGTDTANFATTSKELGAAQVNFQAKGAEITVTSDMTLNGIASAINGGTFSSGNELTATVVDRQLVINAVQSGSSHKITGSGQILLDLGIMSDATTFSHVMQSADDAVFSVNGLTVTRSKNTGLTDVINGVTLNLAADAETKSATLNITSDNSAAKAAINSFITSFNSLQTYLGGKLAVTKQSDGTYSRGTLAGDQSIANLRKDLFTKFSSYDATGGVYKSMRDIGIDFSATMSASITNSSKLEEAMKTNYAEVTKLLDRVMTNIDNKMAQFTGSSKSYVEQLIKSNDSQTKSTAAQITSWNTRLDQRKIYLTNQYAETQAQMTLLTNQQSTNTAWINTLSYFTSA